MAKTDGIIFMNLKFNSEILNLASEIIARSAHEPNEFLF